MKHDYRQYSTADFDNFDCLKISKGIYFILLFVLRGYLVWLMSVTNMNDRIGIMQWIYPEPKFFYLSLISGAVGLFSLFILTLRRPDAKPWVISSWQHLRILLVGALLFDLFVNIWGFYYWQQQSSLWLTMNVMIVFGFIVYLYKSKRVQINLDEFPEKLPEK